MGLFDGISPWWWVALAILLAAAEMLTVTTVLVWSAGAALVTALALWLAPGLGGAEQIALFGALSIAFTFAGRWFVDRFGRREGGVKLNRRAEQLVGRDGVVLSFEHGEGKVDVDGIPRPARIEGPAPTPVPGERVRVVAADGIVVWVRPL
jgi:membrane protein implicated in regulation of membrane protease activity